MKRFLISFLLLFSSTLNVLWAQECVLGSNCVMNPDPSAGAYLPGTVVNICYEITDYDITGLAANWLHGLQFIFGDGWDQSTIVAMPPPSCSGNGNWGWHDSWTSTNSGSSWGPGFGFDSFLGGSLDGDPGNNWGDECSSFAGSPFCLDITVGDCNLGTDLSFEVWDLPDGDSGSWTDLNVCPLEPDDTNPNCSPEISCCELSIDPIPDATACVAAGYTLPPITGTGLTGDEAYYSGPDGTGVQYNEGDIITTMMTLYIYDGVPECFDEVIFMITIAPNLEPEITGILFFCIGGSTDLDAGIYDSYDWDTGESSQVITIGAAGTYAVTVTDSEGCTGETEVNVEESESPMPEIIGELEICSGGSTELDAGDFDMYDWSTGENTQLILVDEEGSYVVTVTDENGCTGETEVYVLVNEAPIVDISGTLEICSGESTELDAGNFDMYEWSTGESTQTITVTSADIYTVTVTAEDGCLAEGEVEVTESSSPEIDVPSTVESCGFYTLPAITGMGLSGDEAYYESPNGAGTQYFPGDEITASTTLYIYDDNAGCVGEVNFDINITFPPEIDPVEDVEVCDSYTLETITGLHLTGAQAYYTESDGNGILYNEGDIIVASTTLFIYDYSIDCEDQESFEITINPTPDIDPMEDQIVCDNYILPSIIGSNLSGAEGYFDEMDGNGSQYFPGDELTESIILYIYDILGDCSDEESFEIIINPTPEINPQDDVTACASYTLQNISGNYLSSYEAYFDQPNGGGNEYTPEDEITATTTLYIFDIIEGCSGEEFFEITILEQPGIEAVEAITACNEYILPIIEGTNLSGIEAYYTEFEGNGNAFQAGNVITESMTLYLYDGIPDCSDEEMLTITIIEMPQIDPFDNVTVCDEFELPLITGENLSGDEVYYDQAEANGAQYNVGDIITNTMTLYAYDGGNGCFDEQSILINITPTPIIDPIEDQIACDSYLLPEITGTNLSGLEAYFDDDGGNGNTYAPGDLITNSTTIFIYDNNNDCINEVAFSITINPTPQIAPLLDVEICGEYLLPLISGASLSGNEAYYENQNGTGIAYSDGDIITSSITLFLYDELNGCSNEESFDITINPYPELGPATTTNPSCGVNNGTIQINVLNLTGNEEYSLNGGVFQSNNTFMNLSSGAYDITVKNGLCESTQVVALSDADGPLVDGVLGQDPNCANDNGIITVTASSTLGVLEYSINGSTFQDENVFENLSAGEYVITVKDENGCEGGTSVTLNLPEGPVIDVITEQDPSCADNDGAITITASSASPGLMYSINGGILQNSNEFIALSAATYLITVVDNNECETTESLILSPPDIPTVDNISTGLPSCGEENGSITVFGLGGTGSLMYSLDGITFSINNEFTNLGEDTYTVYIQDTNTCIDSLEVNLNGEDSPTVAIINTLNPSCGNSNGSIEAQGSGGNGVLTYNIDGGVFEDTGLFENLAAGDYTITVQDEDGCEGTIMASLDPPTLIPSANISGDTTICTGESTNIIFEAEGIAPFTIIYNNGTQLDSLTGNDTLFTVTVMPEMTTTYTLVSISDAYCAADINLSVTVSADLIPVIDAGTGGELNCEIESIVLEGNSNPSGQTYLWTTDVGNIFTGESTLTPTANAPGTYYLTVGNGSCSAVDSVLISQDESVPSVNAGPDMELDCVTNSVILNGSTNCTTCNISWTGPNSFTSDELTPSVTATGEYTLIASDVASNCESSPSVVNVTMDTYIPAVFAVPDGPTNCLNAEVEITVNNPDMGTTLNYTWLGPEGLSIGTNASSLTTTQNGEFSVLVQNTANGCDTIISVEILDNEAYPFVNAGENATLTCDITETTVQGSSTPIANIVYQWLDANNLPIAGANSPELLVTEAAIYYLQATDTLNGCTNQDAVSVIADENLPTANAGNSISFDCSTTDGFLDGSASSGEQLSFEWSGQGIVSGATSANPLVNQLGTYTLIVTDMTNGCTAIDEVIVLENSAVFTGIEATTLEGCAGQTNGTITINGVNGGTPPYQYSFNGSAFDAQTIFTNLNPGDYSLEIIDATGCSFETEIELAEPLGAEVEIIGNLEIDEGETTILSLQTNVGIDQLSSITWQVEQTIIPCELCLELEVTPEATAMYQVEIVDKNGCEVADRVLLLVNKDQPVYIPNVFTPNNDGVNDIFTIYAGEEVTQINYFRIFDRWGEQVFSHENFQPNDPVHGWNAFFNTKLLQPAVYIYVAEIAFTDGAEKLYYGDVTLKR